MFRDIELETAMYFICSFAMPVISILYTLTIKLLNRENKRKQHGQQYSYCLLDRRSVVWEAVYRTQLLTDVQVMQQYVLKQPHRLCGLSSLHGRAGY